ncbi:hypothetical protein ABLE91_05780 [Aquabacter sp. CN5-332]|uniref:hypothetical protein n=1 Tax=Aquabacter sp. CN5-332 TaxID=3156608 RepID=UPI0032B3DE4A
MTWAVLAIDRRAKPATLQRYDDGVYVGGRWVAGDATTSTIQAVIQPPGAADLRMMPEGEWVEGDVVIWTRTPLRTADEDAGTTADEITTALGATYKVIKVATRSEAGFTRAIARLTNDRGRTV